MELPLILFLPHVHLTMSQVLINTHRISVSLGHSLCVGGVHQSATQEGRKGQLTAGSVPRWSLILVSCRYLYFQSWVGGTARGMIIMTLMMRSLNPLLSKQTPQPLCTVQQRLSRHHHQNNSFPRMIII